MGQDRYEGMFLWKPSKNQIEQAKITDYMNWLKKNKNLVFKDYEHLWQWSVTEIEHFWESLWQYFNVQDSISYKTVLSQRKMPGANWFEGAHLNYAEHVFRHKRDEEAAIIAKSEIRPQLQRMTWKELYEQTAWFAECLKKQGIKAGDRVAAYLPNIQEAVIAFLACASIGAIWSSCSPDFGKSAVVERFKQIEPKVLLAVDGYRYKGKDYERISLIKELQAAIPTLEKTFIFPYLTKHPDICTLKHTEIWNFSEFHLNHTPSISFAQVPFQHPLWILYSSGTTGLPKAIVQGHGGILLEHLKQCSLQMNLTEKDRFFWYTTTGWMMWNVVVSGLLTGSAIVLYDGHPGYPNQDSLWQFAEESGVTFFGTSASFLLSCMNAGIKPKEKYKFAQLKSIGSTGSPLPPEGFVWVYENIKEDLWLASLSGGTDICSAFVGGSPLLPVRAGEIQCRHLGASVKSFNEAGREQYNMVGELVVTEPLPSMPLYFWNDSEDKQYQSSYFSMFPNVWRHGDLIKINDQGSCQIYGRSDATINRGGIRIGTSEIYRAVEGLDIIDDSLAVDLPHQCGGSRLLLFIVLKSGVQLTKALEGEIKEQIRVSCSPRHLPDVIYEIQEVPRTINGKKLEVPVKKILMGVELEKAVNLGSLQNPQSLGVFVTLKERFSI